jgi:hypothetical protein
MACAMSDRAGGAGVGTETNTLRGLLGLDFGPMRCEVLTALPQGKLQLGSL